MSLPRISTIVLATGADPRLLRAVRSLLAQDVAGEVIVVNSGGGEVQGLLQKAGLLAAVRLVQSEALLLPGAARNRGLVLVSTPFVAFLACDCVATPGWLAARLRRHEAGEAMVASAILPVNQRNLVSWAYQVVNFSTRLPGLPPALAKRYGASFDRRLFDTYGLFNEAQRSGEDSDFLQRLPKPMEPVWAGDVVTLHDHPTRMEDLLAGEFKRGYWAGIDMRRVFRSDPDELMGFYERYIVDCRGYIKLGLRGWQRLMAYAALPLAAKAIRKRIAGIERMKPLVAAIDAGETDFPP